MANYKAALAKYQKTKKHSKPGGGQRFSALEAALKAKGAKSPAGLAAYIGRKKFGKKKFQGFAAKGK